MKRRKAARCCVLLILTCLLAVSVSASLSEYPFMFVEDDVFETRYVLGDESSPIDVVSATILSTNLARFENLSTEVGTTMMDSEVADVTAIDAIVIGNPCISRAAAVLEGDPDDCFEGLEGSTGYVKLFEQGTKTQLLITGITPEDRQVVARKLAEGDLEAVDGDVYEVKTGTGSVAPKPIAVEQRASNRSEHVEATEEDASETGKKIVEESEMVEHKTVQEPEKESEPYRPIEVSRPERRGFFASVWAGIARFFAGLFG